MDPFLEEPSLWGSVHTRLMNSISDPLAELVSPDFYVDIQQHVTILHPEAEAIRHMIPDGYVVEQPVLRNNYISLLCKGFRVCNHTIALATLRWTSAL
jgi:hypothetical protein